MNIALKAKYSFYSALLFFLVANPETYKIVGWAMAPLFGPIVSPGGCPTVIALVIHTILFFLAILALMMFPRI